MNDPKWEARTIEVAIAASMAVLPERLTVEEMASAAGITVWSLKFAFERVHHVAPIAHIQDVCVQRAQRGFGRWDASRIGLASSVDVVHLRYAVAAADHRRFRGAAAALCIPRPTLSKRIGELKERLGGVTLFLRSTQVVRA